MLREGRIDHKQQRQSRSDSLEGDTGQATKPQQHFNLDKVSEWNTRADIDKKPVFP